MQKQMTENERLLLVMLSEGQKGDITAFRDALETIKEIERENSTVIRDYKQRFVKRDYDEDNFRTAHEYSSLLREHLAHAEPEEDKDKELLLRTYRDTICQDGSSYCRWFVLCRDLRKERLNCSVFQCHLVSVRPHLLNSL